MSDKLSLLSRETERLGFKEINKTLNLLSNLGLELPKNIKKQIENLKISVLAILGNLQGNKKINFNKLSGITDYEISCDNVSLVLKKAEKELKDIKEIDIEDILFNKVAEESEFLSEKASENMDNLLLESDISKVLIEISSWYEEDKTKKFDGGRKKNSGDFSRLLKNKKYFDDKIKKIENLEFVIKQINDFREDFNQINQEKEKLGNTKEIKNIPEDTEQNSIIVIEDKKEDNTPKVIKESIVKQENKEKKFFSKNIEEIKGFFELSSKEDSGAKFMEFYKNNFDKFSESLKVNILFFLKEKGLDKENLKIDFKKVNVMKLSGSDEDKWSYLDSFIFDRKKKKEKDIQKIETEEKIVIVEEKIEETDEKVNIIKEDKVVIPEVKHVKIVEKAKDKQEKEEKIVINKVDNYLVADSFLEPLKGTNLTEVIKTNPCDDGVNCSEEKLENEGKYISKTFIYNYYKDYVGAYAIELSYRSDNNITKPNIEDSLNNFFKKNVKNKLEIKDFYDYYKNFYSKVFNLEQNEEDYFLKDFFDKYRLRILDEINKELGLNLSRTDIYYQIIAGLFVLSEKKEFKKTDISYFDTTIYSNLIKLKDKNNKVNWKEIVAKIKEEILKRNTDIKEENLDEKFKLFFEENKKNKRELLSKEKTINNEKSKKIALSDNVGVNSIETLNNQSSHILNLMKCLETDIREFDKIVELYKNENEEAILYFEGYIDLFDFYSPEVDISFPLGILNDYIRQLKGESKIQNYLEVSKKYEKKIDLDEIKKEKKIVDSKKGDNKLEKAKGENKTSDRKKIKNINKKRREKIWKEEGLQFYKTMTPILNLDGYDEYSTGLDINNCDIETFDLIKDTKEELKDILDPNLDEEKMFKMIEIKNIKAIYHYILSQVALGEVGNLEEEIFKLFLEIPFNSLSLKEDRKIYKKLYKLIEKND